MEGGGHVGNAQEPGLLFAQGLVSSCSQIFNGYVPTCVPKLDNNLIQLHCIKKYSTPASLSKARRAFLKRPKTFSGPKSI